MYHGVEACVSEPWFSSDSHFGHFNIIKHCKRPFKSIMEMDQTIITRWNEKISPTDTVYHLGDFAWNPMVARAVLGKLNGTIHLIRGNHDKRTLKKGVELLFASVNDYLEIKVKDEEMDVTQNIVLMHYPIESWNKRHHGSWHLHGHCHGTLPSGDHQARIDVGVDPMNFYPVSYNEIKGIMTGKVFKPIDHHKSRA